MHTERFRRYAYILICLAGLCALLYVGAKYLVPMLLPFLLAWGVVQLTRPVALFFHRKVHLPLRLCRTLTALLSILLLLTGVFGLTLYLGSEGWRWLSQVAQGEELTHILDFLFDPFGKLFSSRPELSALEGRIEEAVSSAIGGLVGTVTTWLSGLIGAVPQLLLFFIVTLIATVYVSWDLERVNRAVLSLLPERMRGSVLDFKARFLSGVWPYVRSYLILMLLTFGIMAVGLCILRVEYALLVAVIIALLDPLPVIGVGTILIPWSLFQLFFGSVPLGVGLLVLYIVHEIFRQIAEPRIVGRSMGLHPLLTLMLLYVGYSVLGFLGLLLLPLLTVTLHVLLSSRKSQGDKEKTVGHDREASPDD